MNVAFQEGSGFSVFSNAREPVYVNLNYHKQVTDETGSQTTEEFEMHVPLLLLLHVPYFEVENVTIDFNVKLNSVRKRLIEEDGGVGGGFSLPFLTVNGSYQRTDKRSQTVERTYDQSVHVQAGSIELPTGVTRILDVLEQTITETAGSEEESNGNGNGG